MKLKESGENYLEAILKIEQSKGVVKSIDVANELKVSRPSVCRAINNLKLDGLIEKEAYGSIFITPKGRKRAAEIMKKHGAIKTFLVKVLKVSENAAEIDACKIEHDLSAETTEKFLKFVENLK